MTHPRPVLLVLTVLAVAPLLSAYNVSPVPNVVFSESMVNQGSYFGYAIHLKKEGLFVGAPRAQSSLPKQRRIVEPGAIFRCNVNDGSCLQYDRLDDKGRDSFVNKSGQYFGASLDGIVDREDLVGCAPRFVYEDSDDRGEITERAMTGICYARVKNATITLKDSFVFRQRQSAFDGASEGFSVHMVQSVEKGLEVVSGLPFYNFSGAVIIYSGANGSVLHSVQEKPGGYFGYSVNSMVIQNKTIYVASAPRSNGSPGKVFIFETTVVKKKQLATQHQVVLLGDEIRDYFGYSLCTEDINGDGLPDVLVGAPYFSMNSLDDHGAVFVFINQGFAANGTLMFKRQLILTSSYDGSGYFGYSIASLGDINNDGFNDIAIGAPFERQGGAVYIHHGSASGITRDPSQILKISNSNETKAMFGAAIARAVDIDGNIYNDLAVGAPIEDRVYLFKTYPILRPMVSMNASISQINLRNVTSGNDTVTDEFELEICYQYEIVGNSAINHEYDFETTLSLDVRNSIVRATTDSDLQLLRFSNVKQCIRKNIAVNTTFYHVDNPMVFEMTYKLINQNTTDGAFCESCAILEKTKNTINYVKHTVFFGKECDNDECKVDMKLHGEVRNLNASLVVNSTKTLELMYEITNMGDVAYATKLSVNFSQNVKILKKIGYCDSTGVNMTCNINNGRALRNNTVIVVNVTLDGTTLTGDQLVITARLSSSGKEIDDADNSHRHVIQLKRFSEVDVRGIYNPSYFDIDKQEGISIIKSKLIVENLGPSNIQNTTVSVLIPEMFDNGASSCPLIKAVKSVKITNGDQQLNFSESSSTLPSTSQNLLKPFNESTNSNLDFLRNKQEVILSCHQAYVRCRNVTFFLTDINPTPESLLQVELELNVLPKALLKLFSAEDNALVSLFVTVAFDNSQSDIHQSTHGSIVFYRTGSGVPMWVYVVSVLLGALILAVITHLLHKCQFFKRMTQSEMEAKLTRENSKKIAFTDGSVMMICDSTASILA